MAAYHSIAVTLGQAGLLNELMTIVECMRQKPSKRIKNMNRRNWDPCLEPDIVIYNAVRYLIPQKFCAKQYKYKSLNNMWHSV